MSWNWQQPNWPHFKWNPEKLASFEAGFLKESGVLLGSIRHFNDNDKLLLTVDMITGEAIKTSEIEQEYLNRDSVQYSVLRNFGLETDNRRVPPAERGIAEMMTDLYRNYNTPLTHETLYGWHRMIASGRTDLKDIGNYRQGGDPMQILSGPVSKPQIHFEAPPAAQIGKEMDAFIKWFQTNDLPALTRAGIAHLYFVSIHPFEDGNGRISRALAEKTLAQSLGQPTLIALSQIIQDNRKAYYEALENNNKDIEITDWLIYFAKTILDAQTYTQKMVDFLIAKTKLYDRLRGQLNDRQNRVLTRLFEEGPKGFKGGLSADNYLRITDTSRATATRDLQQLVEIGALIKTGELKGTRYYLNI